MIRRLGFILLVVALAAAQDRPTFRIKVDLVVLSFTITDNKGHYVNGLKPLDGDGCEFCNPAPNE